MNLFRTGAAGKALREASRAACAALLATSVLAMAGSAALAEARSTSTINGLTVDVIGGGSQAISATDAGVLIAHDGHRIEAEKGRITVDGQSHEVEPYATLTVRRDGYAYSVKADDTVIYEVSRIKGLKAAAEKGDAGAMNDLGVAYGEGEGVPQDWAKAAEYYRQAAEKGMMVSQSNYAYRLWNGEGVAEDHEAAVAWARKAADQGYAKAKNFVAVALLNGDGAPQDTDAALALFEEAALDGYVDAARNLGLIRRKGIAGAIVDEAAARKWYGMAADAGDAQAIAALEEMGPAPAESAAPAPAASGTQVAATAEVEGGPPPLPKKAEEDLPPPLPKKEEKPQISYFYALDDTRAGPVEGNVLEGLITDGTVKRDTLVWSKGMADWQPAGEVEALGPVFAALPPALPKAGMKPAATPNPTPVAKPKPLGGGFDGDWARYLAGNWVYALQQEGASLNLQVTLGADGSFAGQSHIQLPNQPPQQDSAKGKFTVEPLSDGKALMRVVYDDGDSDDSVLRRVGPDEIFNETEGFPLRRQQEAGMRAGLLRLLPGLAALVLAAGIARAAPDDPYYYGLNDERQGPVTETVLLQKLHDGALPLDTLVWTKGMADWQEAATVFDLRAPQAQTTDNRAAGEGAVDAKALRLKLTEIMDPSGFEQPTRAASTVIPADWTAQGGVIWKVNNECAGGQQFQWQALSPDGRAAISMLPNTAWATSSLGGGIRRDCLRMRMDSAEDFVRHLVSQLDQGRVVDIFRDPATMKTVSAFNYETPGDPYIKHWRDAVAATFSFRQNGEDYRAVATFMTLHFHMVSGHSFGIGAPAEMTNGSSVMLTTFEAPAAEFDALLPAFMMFHANFRIDPAWQARISKMNRNMAQDNLETSRNIARINADTSASILDSGMESWRRRQQSEGRLSRETSEMIRGEETYAAQTPSGQISLPGGYANAYQLNDGTFVVTNDAFFDPRRSTGQDGTRLDPLR